LGTNGQKESKKGHIVGVGGKRKFAITKYQEGSLGLSAKIQKNRQPKEKKKWIFDGQEKDETKEPEKG